MNSIGNNNPEAQGKLKIRLASPRGFCAGVERAIRTVEDALAVHGAPVYVRHEIVHNRHVVDRLRTMGAVFVEELSQTDSTRPVIFSAHGAPADVYVEAQSKGINAIDATCPLVSKVHNQVRRHIANGRRVILIGHANHQEVIGTMGQAPKGSVILIENEADVAGIPTPEGELGYVTQTTLSVDDTQSVIAALRRRFPDIRAPAREDICYATTNRQAAVKAIAPETDLFIIIGSRNSSNSQRLVETAKKAGARDAILIDDASELDLDALRQISTISISSGASAPEALVEGLIARIAENFPLSIETIEVAREDISFKSPLRLAS